MFARIRTAIGVALVALFITSVNAFAKGGFDFITITTPDLEAIQITDTRLTEDFFAFANFYEDKTKAPADPGVGYEITRHYVQGVRAVIFDRLHYYPETGFVFYDGIENGESEYDGEWYAANAEIKSMFVTVLADQAGSVAPAEKKGRFTSSQSEASTVQAKSVEANLPSSLIMGITLIAGVVALFAFAFWRRKPSVQ